MAAPRTKETSGLMLLTSPPFILAVAGWFWSTTARWVSGSIDPPLDLSLLYRRRGGDGAGAERGGGGGPSNKQGGWLLLIRGENDGEEESGGEGGIATRQAFRPPQGLETGE